MASVYTDEAGQYRIDSLGGGDFLVHIDAQPWGYVRTRQPVALVAGENTRLDFTLRPAAAISGIFVDENGEPFEISEKANGNAHTIDPTVSKETGGRSWTSTGYRNKYSEKEIWDVQPGLSFTGGQGDYGNCRMVFPASSSFLIEAILPGETTIMFSPKEQGMEVKKILHNGENIMAPTELRGAAMRESFALANLETSPGQTVEGVAIVLGPAK